MAFSDFKMHFWGFGVLGLSVGGPGDCNTRYFDSRILGARKGKPAPNQGLTLARTRSPPAVWVFFVEETATTFSSFFVGWVL